MLRPVGKLHTEVSGTPGFAKAGVADGGVRRSAVDAPAFDSRTVPAP
jgi:predicted flavoprotein YhiN